MQLQRGNQTIFRLLRRIMREENTCSKAFRIAPEHVGPGGSGANLNGILTGLQEFGYVHFPAQPQLLAHIFTVDPNHGHIIGGYCQHSLFPAAIHRNRSLITTVTAVVGISGLLPADGRDLCGSSGDMIVRVQQEAAGEIQVRRAGELGEVLHGAFQLDDILALEYLPGQILNEKDMIEKFSCSKAPVREALQALCIDGVLRSIPRYGYEVVRLTMDDIREMLQFRIVLESGMIRARGTKLTPAQLDRLDEIDKLCTEAADDPWTHWAYNTEFHLKLITFCGNSYAVEQLSRCMTRLCRGYAQKHFILRVFI